MKFFQLASMAFLALFTTFARAQADTSQPASAPFLHQAWEYQQTGPWSDVAASHFDTVTAGVIILKIAE